MNGRCRQLVMATLTIYTSRATLCIYGRELFDDNHTGFRHDDGEEVGEEGENTETARYPGTVDSTHYAGALFPFFSSSENDSLQADRIHNFVFK